MLNLLQNLFFRRECIFSAGFGSWSSPRPSPRLKHSKRTHLLWVILETCVLLSSVALFSSFVVGRPCAVFKHENSIWAYVRHSKRHLGDLAITQPIAALCRALEAIVTSVCTGFPRRCIPTPLDRLWLPRGRQQYKNAQAWAFQHPQALGCSTGAILGRFPRKVFPACDVIYCLQTAFWFCVKLQNSSRKLLYRRECIFSAVFGSWSSSRPREQLKPSKPTHLLCAPLRT